MAIYYMKLTPTLTPTHPPGADVALTPTLTPTHPPGADVALADELGFSIKLLGELVSK